MKQLFEINSKEELETVISQAIENALAKTNHKERELKEELLTTEELCDFLKLSRTSVWSLTKNGIIPFLRIGNHKRYQKIDVIKKLKEFKNSKQ